jgi:restriction system protein
MTAEGKQYLAEHPEKLSKEQVEEIATGNMNVRLRPLEGDADHGQERSMLQASERIEEATSPDDRLEQALTELNDSVAEEILEAIGNSSPEFFEALVLDVLHAMGYGTSRRDLQRVGGSGDGGIDGIISLDRLGLEKVYVQAKRWQNSVGRPDVQGFYGALAGQRANKGVFITTSTFTSPAVEFARSVERIVLVDGKRLAQLLIEFGVGVSHRVVKVAKVDSDYFE